MRVAGPAAVGFVRAGRKDRAEHAVLHVEHGHVLVNDDFQPCGRHGGDKIEKLIAIEVVGRRDALPRLAQSDTARSARWPR